jgi:hypothetical protein
MPRNAASFLADIPDHRQGARARWWRPVSLVLVFTLLAIPAIGAVQHRAAKAQTAPVWPATAALAPADAPVYLAASLDPASPQWQALAAIVSRLGLDAVIEEAKDDLLGNFHAAPGAGSEAAFRDLEVALAVTSVDLLTGGRDTTMGGGSGLAIIVRAADITMWEIGVRRTLELAASAAGQRVARSTYNGIVILSVASEQLAMARAGDALVLGEAPEDLRPVIDVYQGDRPSLATTAAWQTFQSALPVASLVVGYADGTKFLGVAREQIAADESLRPVGADLLRLLDGQIAFAVTAQDDGLRLDALVARRAGSGWPAVPANQPLGLDTRVPASTVLFLNGMNFGQNPVVELITLFFATGLVSQLEDTLFVPSAVEPADVYARAARLLGFNLRDDFLAQLVGEFGLALTVDGLDPNGIDGIFASQVQNPVRVNDAVSKMAALINAGLASAGLGLGLQTREADGGLIQMLDVPLPDYDTTIHIEFGVAAGQFVLGYGSGLRDYLSGTGASLVENPRYQTAVQALPAERDWTFYLDVARLVELASQAGGIPEPEALAGQGQPDWTAIDAVVAGGYARGNLRGLTVMVRIPEPALPPATPVASPVPSPAASPVAVEG